MKRLTIVLAAAALAGCATAPAPSAPSAPAASAAPAAPATPAVAKSSLPPVSFDEPPGVGTKAICPVADSEFVVREDTARGEHDGRHYVFCCPGCGGAFSGDPAQYVRQ